MTCLTRHVMLYVLFHLSCLCHTHEPTHTPWRARRHTEREEHGRSGRESARSLRTASPVHLQGASVTLLEHVATRQAGHRPKVPPCLSFLLPVVGALSQMSSMLLRIGRAASGGTLATPVTFASGAIFQKLGYIQHF